MLSMLVLAAAAASAPPRVIVLPPDIARQVAPICKPIGPQVVGSKPNAPISAKKLNELPNANEYLAVIRRDADGCDKPAIIAYDIGSAPSKKQR